MHITTDVLTPCSTHICSCTESGCDGGAVQPGTGDHSGRGVPSDRDTAGRH